jgi:predicted Zn-dependent protease
MARSCHLPDRRTHGQAKAQALVVLAVLLITLVGYLRTRQVNEATGEAQTITLTVEQEIALGERLTPAVLDHFGGESADLAARQRVERIGSQLLEASDAAKGPYRLAFRLLASGSVANAMAAPGGPVFVTQRLVHELPTDGQLAYVLGHEIGHVVARHAAERLTTRQLAQGATGAAAVGAYGGGAAEAMSAPASLLLGSLLSLRFSRADELQADTLAVRYAAQAGYDPRAALAALETLHRLHPYDPSGFVQTHPDPQLRREAVRQWIADQYPDGVPAGLAP